MSLFIFNDICVLKRTARYWLPRTILVSHISWNSPCLLGPSTTGVFSANIHSQLAWITLFSIFFNVLLKGRLVRMLFRRAIGRLLILPPSKLCVCDMFTECICVLTHCLLDATLDVRAGLEVGLHLLQLLHSDPAWADSLDYFSFDCGCHRKVTDTFMFLPRGSLSLPIEARPIWSAANPSYPSIPKSICAVCGVEKDIFAMEQHMWASLCRLFDYAYICLGGRARRIRGGICTRSLIACPILVSFGGWLGIITFMLLLIIPSISSSRCILHMHCYTCVSYMTLSLKCVSWSKTWLRKTFLRGCPFSAARRGQPLPEWMTSSFDWCGVLGLIIVLPSYTAYTVSDI